ncbi:hypothetical protein [Cognatiyoonia sp. IB215182]|uniref:hypothetical protein n=1 Tax=Cognatiyoonia sp. IB215182 TaxID=3097353 RepID=UPI002A12A927|nr:hypothetical protein [Cognatiyoonia sp. IB215182]MDX8354515.1 hypothetical protein [Cognatiyoonia sp. IB215182]
MAKPLFQIVGLLLICLGTALFLALGAHLGGVRTELVAAAGVNAMGLYLGATAGSVMIGWGTILMLTARRTDLHGPVGLGTGLGFLALSLMRLWIALAAHEDFSAIAILMPGEIVLFLALAIAFFQAAFDFWSRLVDAFRSLNAAPIWVQIWVWSFLAPVNMASFVFYGFTNHPLPGWIALGFMFVLLSNMSIVLYERGISKITSLPHLIPWVPLQIYAGYWLFVWGDLSPSLAVYAWAYFVIIGISNVFDLYDTYRWVRGERAILQAQA